MISPKLTFLEKLERDLEFNIEWKKYAEEHYQDTEYYEKNIKYLEKKIAEVKEQQNS